MKKVVVISSSLRINSNSEILALECVKGAKEAGNEVEFISLQNKDIKFCKGCFACQQNQKCIIKDDTNEIADIIKEADVLVFATPIYYYEMSGQLKTLLDRMNPLYASDYKFREVYMIATAADNASEAFDKAYLGLAGWVECFEKASLKGIIRGGGINEVKEVFDHPNIINEAYKLGKNL